MRQGSTGILEKVLKFSQQFSRPEKSLENKDKVWKSGKNSRVFFFQSYSKSFISEFFFFFRFGQILLNLARAFALRHEKKLCSCVF